jgi:hypothetical protein
MTRKVTNKVLEAADEGLLTWEHIASAALKYMSEDQVADMAHANEFFMYEEDDDEEEDEEEQWSPYTADFNDPGSVHHY